MARNATALVKGLPLVWMGFVRLNVFVSLELCFLRVLIILNKALVEGCLLEEHLVLQYWIEERVSRGLVCLKSVRVEPMARIVAAWICLHHVVAHSARKQILPHLFLQALLGA